VSLVSLILSGYVFAATFDDRWSNYRGFSNEYSQDRGPDDYGVGGDAAH
jgi:hypothetical protein